MILQIFLCFQFVFLILFFEGLLLLCPFVWFISFCSLPASVWPHGAVKMIFFFATFVSMAFAYKHLIVTSLEDNGIAGEKEKNVHFDETDAAEPLISPKNDIPETSMNDIFHAPPSSPGSSPSPRSRKSGADYDSHPGEICVDFNSDAD